MSDKHREYGFVLSVSPFYFLMGLLCLVYLPSLAGADVPASPDRLIQEARRKTLWEDPCWRTLLHYKRSALGDRSLIDDPSFFLSPKGKSDPRSELEATIKALFGAQAGNGESPVCRFIARYTWLADQLAIAPSDLPGTLCEKFEKVLADIGPGSATLVFPTYYMNNPASMFGHTLLLIETAKGSRLMAHALNYSALTDETNGIFFAVKGLFGFYKGYYSVLPYYRKIQEYSDISQRDMWEYPLNLTPSEIRRLLMHLWELRDTYADYYFFDENCSYNLLFLLEAARPSLRLTDRFPLWALPIDTIKAMKTEGLIRSADYRPSKATRIRHKMELLDDEGREVALKIIRNDLPPSAVSDLGLTKARQIRILDLVAEGIQYQYAKKKLPKARYQETLLSTLKIRSRLKQADAPKYEVPEPSRPNEIHGTRRLRVGMGLREGHEFQEISYRPVFSDLTDTDYVSHQGTQIEFFNTTLRYYASDKKLVLEDLDFIDIISLAPRDDFFRPYSWKVATGLTRKLMDDGEDHQVYHLGTGGGMAFHTPGLGLWYGLAEPALNISGRLETGYALGIGASAGLLKPITPFWKCHLSARQIWFELGDKHRTTEASLSQNIRLTKNQSVHLNLSWERAFDNERTEATLSWYLFF